MYYMRCKEKYKLPDLKSFEKMVDGIWQREYYTNQGPLAIELESKIEKFLEVKHAVCMTNNSIALMIAILAMETKGKAIIPALSHINVAQSVKWAGLEYQFCDIQPDHPTIDVTQLKTAEINDTGLIIALNPFGHACDMETLEV